MIDKISNKFRDNKNSIYKIVQEARNNSLLVDWEIIKYSEELKKIKTENELLKSFLKNEIIKEDWKFDDLWEEGYRFDNSKLRLYVEVPKYYADTKEDALSILIEKPHLLDFKKHT